MSNFVQFVLTRSLAAALHFLVILNTSWES